VPPENWTGDNIHFERGIRKWDRNGGIVKKHPDKKEQKLIFFLSKNRGALH